MNSVAARRLLGQNGASQRSSGPAEVIKDEPGRNSPKACPNRNWRVVPASVIAEDFAPAAEGFVADDDESACPFEIDWIWRGIRGDIDLWMAQVGALRRRRAVTSADRYCGGRCLTTPRSWR